MEHRHYIEIMITPIKTISKSRSLKACFGTVQFFEWDTPGLLFSPYLESQDAVTARGGRTQWARFMCPVYATLCCVACTTNADCAIPLPCRLRGSICLPFGLQRSDALKKPHTRLSLSEALSTNTALDYLWRP